jgi:hypothetical protein
MLSVVNQIRAGVIDGSDAPARLASASGRSSRPGTDAGGLVVTVGPVYARGKSWDIIRLLVHAGAPQRKSKEMRIGYGAPRPPAILCSRSEKR